MVSRGAAWTTPGLRFFVRAVVVGSVNLISLPLWFGDPYVLRDHTSLGEALAPIVVAMIAGLVTAEIVLRVFELPGRGFAHRYSIVLASVCLGGAMMGAPLAVQFAVDGTLGADPPPAVYADPLALLGALASATPAGAVGAVFGAVIGAAEGVVLAFPFAAALGMFPHD